MMMQKAYITFASKQNINPDGSVGRRNQWPDLTLDIQAQNHHFISNMHDGVYPHGIETDPRSVPNPAEQTANILNKSSASNP